MSCGVGCRRSLGPTLLWLWRRLAATAPIRPLAWELPYAKGAAQEIAKTHTHKKKRRRRRRRSRLDALITADETDESLHMYLHIKLVFLVLRNPEN